MLLIKEKTLKCQFGNDELLNRWTKLYHIIRYINVVGFSKQYHWLLVWSSIWIAVIFYSRAPGRLILIELTAGLRLSWDWCSSSTATVELGSHLVVKLILRDNHKNGGSRHYFEQGVNILVWKLGYFYG